jgi:hypothetical protein
MIETLNTVPDIQTSVDDDVILDEDASSIIPKENREYIVKKALMYAKKVAEHRELSRDFIDFILRCKLYELALEADNTEVAQKYWEMIKGITHSHR